jgi:ethanolamine utilization protein EutN
MRIAKLFGSVVLSRCHPSFQGARLRLAVPLTLDELRAGAEPAAEEMVVWDQLSAGDGTLIALADGAEAAQPFRPEVKPVDAYCAALLDHIALHGASAAPDRR